MPDFCTYWKRKTKYRWLTEEIRFITWAVGSYWLYHPEPGPVVPAPLRGGGTCRWPVLPDQVLWSCRVPLRLGTDWLSCSSESYSLRHKLSLSWRPHVGFKHIFLVLPRVLPKCWDSSLSRNVLRSVRPHFLHTNNSKKCLNCSCFHRGRRYTWKFVCPCTGCAHYL